MGFLPEPLFLLPDSHALRIPNTIILLLYLTYKAHRKKSEENSKRGGGDSCHETHSYIGQILPSPKDPLILEEKSCLVYEVPCFDFDFVYIRQTKQDLKSRLAEHKLANEKSRTRKISFM